MSYVKFKSALNGMYMACEAKHFGPDDFIYAINGADYTVLLFEQGGDDVSSAYRVINAPPACEGKPKYDLWMSYRGSTGAMKLVTDSKDASWQITPQGNVHGIRNTTYNDYIWTTSSGNIYLTRHGNPTDVDSQWIVEKVS